MGIFRRNSYTDASRPSLDKSRDSSSSSRFSEARKTDKVVDHQKSNFFGRHRSTRVAKPVDEPFVASTTHTKGGLFHRSNSLNDRTSRRSDGSGTLKSSRGLVGAVGVRPQTSEALHAAREGLQRAIDDEKEAVEALNRSKMSLREAKHHVQRLEQEARMEAKVAEAKLKEVSGMKKVANTIGKH